jgi:hypothetical protein
MMLWQGTVSLDPSSRDSWQTVGQLDFFVIADLYKPISKIKAIKVMPVPVQ